MHKPDQQPKAADCLSQEELVGYLRGTLTEAEVRRVEEHITDCDLCATAIEGLMTSGSVEDHVQAIEELKGHIQPGEPAQIKALFPYRVAAAVALLLGSLALLWVFVPKRSEQAYAPQDKVTAVSPTQVQAPPTEQSPTEPTVQETKSVAIQAPLPVAPKNPPAATTLQVQREAAKDEAEVAQEMVQVTEVTAPAETKQLRDQVDDVRQQETTDAALSKDNNKVASKEVLSMTASAPADCKRELSKGKKHYLNGDFQTAVQLIEPCLFTAGGDQRETLLWYLGRSCMEIGQTTRGLEYLRSCISLKGKHEQEALTFLKKKGY